MASSNRPRPARAAPRFERITAASGLVFKNSLYSCTAPSRSPAFCLLMASWTSDCGLCARAMAPKLNIMKRRVVFRIQSVESCEANSPLSLGTYFAQSRFQLFLVEILLAQRGIKDHSSPLVHQKRFAGPRRIRLF